MLDEDHPKIYGLDKVNKTKTVYVTEGPFDSHFITNAIAMCGSDVDEYVVKGGDSITDYQLIFVDSTEKDVASNKARGITGPG